VLGETKRHAAFRYSLVGPTFSPEWIEPRCSAPTRPGLVHADNSDRGLRLASTLSWGAFLVTTLLPLLITRTSRRCAESSGLG